MKVGYLSAMLVRVSGNRKNLSRKKQMVLKRKRDVNVRNKY